jgi:membrane protein implicated in regulation of membrane protease activity
MTGVHGNLAYWLFRPEVWMILGIVLVLADVLIGFATFVLPVGIAAAIVAGLLYGQQNLWYGDHVLFEVWRDVGLWFAGLSILSIAIVKLAFQRKRGSQDDINQY